MRHVAAYLLLSLGGNSAPTSDDVSDLLSSVGIEPDKKSLKERDPNIIRLILYLNFMRVPFAIGSGF